ncbi:hypothetical protein LRS10_03775 [Phenylobacterium sp. J426]|uniref:glycosyltransferase n=1 Tax=Phenylobacterium sp. J426 TaxID=2898439 RepID=UPI0021509794|nr:hypothetical protein [Phenylobacterium sp. J426]MCR5873389.1 hypothetical protein [Phenylobacterium sp. J426]
MAVSVDMPMLVERLTALVSDGALRRRMGETGRRRAREDYDWSHIYRRYQALWDELSAIRVREYEGNRAYWDRAPRSAPGHRDPFEVFAGFPTRTLGPRARVERTETGSAEAYVALESDVLFSHWKIAPPIVEALFQRLAAGPATMTELQAVSTLDMALTAEVVGRLAKMNLVRPL